jgi:hypothetical protein
MMHNVLEVCGRVMGFDKTANLAYRFAILYSTDEVSGHCCQVIKRPLQ